MCELLVGLPDVNVSSLSTINLTARSWCTSKPDENLRGVGAAGSGLGSLRVPVATARATRTNEPDESENGLVFVLPRAYRPAFFDASGLGQRDRDSRPAWISARSWSESLGPGIRITSIGLNNQRCCNNPGIRRIELRRYRARMRPFCPWLVRRRLSTPDMITKGPLTSPYGARPEGFEPPTLGLEVRRSIH